MGAAAEVEQYPLSAILCHKILIMTLCFWGSASGILPFLVKIVLILDFIKHSKSRTDYKQFRAIFFFKKKGRTWKEEVREGGGVLLMQPKI